MVTKETLSQTYDNLPDSDKSVLLAISILMDRIRSLPKVDRDALFELFQTSTKTNDPEEMKSIRGPWMRFWPNRLQPSNR